MEEYTPHKHNSGGDTVWVPLGSSPFQNPKVVAPQDNNVDPTRGILADCISNTADHGDIKAANTSRQSDIEAASISQHGDIEATGIFQQAEIENIGISQQADIEGSGIYQQAETEATGLSQEGGMEAAGALSQSDVETSSTLSHTNIKATSSLGQINIETISPANQSNFETISTLCQSIIESLSPLRQTNVEILSQSDINSTATLSQINIKDTASSSQIHIEAASTLRQGNIEASSTSRQSDIEGTSTLRHGINEPTSTLRHSGINADTTPSQNDIEQKLAIMRERRLARLFKNLGITHPPPFLQATQTDGGSDAPPPPRYNLRPRPTPRVVKYRAPRRQRHPRSSAQLAAAIVNYYEQEACAPPPPPLSREDVPCGCCRLDLRTVTVPMSVTRCGHLFCTRCLDIALQPRTRKCPQCKCRVPADKVRPVYFTSHPRMSCSICAKDMRSPTVQKSVTKCGHIFCTKCLYFAVLDKHMCPQCRTPINLRQYHQVSF